MGRFRRIEADRTGLEAQFAAPDAGQIVGGGVVEVKFPPLTGGGRRGRVVGMVGHRQIPPRVSSQIKAAQTVRKAPR